VKLKKVVALVRLSTAEQARDGRAGIMRQRNDIEMAAHTHGLQIVRTAEVIDVSGADVRFNSDFATIFADLARPDIDGLVCSNLDR
jgi:DNA invertase Pin-like site-specific DNA recombinase